jgi:hypothetical protein
MRAHWADRQGLEAVLAQWDGVAVPTALTWKPEGWDMLTLSLEM